MYVRAQTLRRKRRILPPLMGAPATRELVLTKQRFSMNGTTQALRSSRLHVAVGLTVVLLLAACASAPPAPTASLQAARQAISNAERADAGRYAAGELGAARTHIASADAAVAERKMIVAERFADESRADAELASAKTAAAKAGAVNDELKRSTGTLIQEMQRNAGAKP
jgi:hypothetical protein